MQAESSKLSYPADEVARNARLARGLRAVAATVIIGGIVLAAFDGGAPTSRSTPRGDAIDATQATGVPLVNPPAEALPASPSQDDSTLRRLDHAVEQHG